MDWSDQVFSYCERGGDPGFWAEPLNAVSNGAFIIAGIVAAWQLASAARSDRALPEWGLVLLVFVIGTGSFLFHTYATAWAILADTIPITLFMLAYLGYALRRFVGLPWIVVLAALLAFYAAVKFAQGIPCSNELLPMTRAAGKRCFNGTLGYAPAFVALVLVGALLAWQRHPAARYLLGAAAVFFTAMTFRTIDYEVCTWAVRGGRGVGSHFLWHALNAVVLYVLLLGAIRYGQPRAALRSSGEADHKGAG